MSNTFLVGERDTPCLNATWVGPRNYDQSSTTGVIGMVMHLGAVDRKMNLPLNVNGNGAPDCHRNFSSLHSGGGSQFVFCDGRVAFVSEHIQFNNNTENMGIYNKLGRRDDGLTVGDY